MQSPDEMLPKDKAMVDGLKAWSVRVDRGAAPGKTRAIVDSSPGGEVLVCKADLVFGMDHLRSALYHAARAVEEGRNSSDSLAMETLLYASGERQLGTAIKKMAPDETTEQIVVARLRGNGPMPGSDWKELPEEPGRDALMNLTRFGISKQEIETVGAARAVDLVLERVALVDILKK